MMLGNHAARLDSLEEKSDEISKDVKEILRYMERSKGSWKTLVALGAVVGTLVEIGHWFLQLVGGKTPHG